MAETCTELNDCFGVRLGAVAAPSLMVVVPGNVMAV